MDPVAIAVALLSSLVGVLIGAAITLRQDKNAQATLNRGAARITYFELAENFDYLDTAIRSAVTMPVKTATWTETRARLATQLSPGDFVIVATAYMKLGATAAAWSDRPLGGSQDAESVTATIDVLKQIEAASMVLYPHAWPDMKDRAALDASLQDQLGEHTLRV